MKRLVTRLILVLLAGAAWQALTADVLTAQQGVPVQAGVPAGEGVAVQGGVPEQTGAASGQGVAVPLSREEVVRAEPDPEEIPDEEIRELLVEQSIARFKELSGRRPTFFTGMECSELTQVRGPPLICDPADVTAEQVEEYRELQRQLRSTFLTEPTPVFLYQSTPQF